MKNEKRFVKQTTKIIYTKNTIPFRTIFVYYLDNNTIINASTIYYYLTRIKYFKLREKFID